MASCYGHMAVALWYMDRLDDSLACAQKAMQLAIPLRRVDVMAKAIEVSRGSFYWHFESISAFHDQLIAHWGDQTRTLANEMSRLSEPADQLQYLIGAAHDQNQQLENAFRTWAHFEPKVARAVESLDADRISELTSVLSRALGSPSEARRRAIVFYSAALGHSRLTSGQSEFGPRDFKRIAALFVSRV